MSAVPVPATAPRRRPAVREADLPVRRRRHLRVVQDEPRRHTGVFLLLYLVVAAAIVLGAVSLNALAAGDAVTARELDTEVVVAERTYEQLVADVATLEDPARIRAAAESMGLVPAQEPRFLAPARGLPGDLAPAEPADDTVKPVLTADGQ